MAKKPTYEVLEQRVKELENEAIKVNQAKKALQKSEDEMRAIMNAADETIVLIDRQSMVVTANQTVCERLGVNKEDFIGRCLYDFFPPEVAENRRRKFELVFTTGKSVSFEDNREGMFFEQNAYPVFSNGHRVEKVAVFARDITKRKQTEEKLKRSEEKFAKTFHNGPALMTISSIKDGKYMEVNDNFVNVTGYSKEEAIGTTPTDLGFILEDELDKLNQALLKNGRVDGMEIMLHKKDGDTFHCLYFGEIITIDEEQGLLSIASDITERKHAEERIGHTSLILHGIRNVNQLITREKDRDKLLQAVCNILIETRGYYKAWIALLDESGKLLKTAEAGLGDDFLPMLERLKRGELSDNGRKVLSLSDIVITEDPSSTCADCPLAEKYGGRSAMSIRLAYEEKVYGLLSVSISGDFTACKEEQELFREVAEDISYALYNIEQEDERKRIHMELEESEEKYRTLLETTSEGYALLDPELKIIDVNESLCRMLGYSQDEIIGKTPFDLADDENRKIFVEQTSKIPTTRHRSYGITLKKKNGEDVYTYFNATTIREKSGEALGSFAFITDMTDKLALENRLRQAQKMESIGTLAGGIAHDFNNILGAIIGLSELSLLETREGSSLHRHIEKMLEAGMRAKSLVQQILAFSRQRDQVRIPMDITPVIKETLKFLRSSVSSAIQINQYVTKDPGLIKGDPTQIHQVLMNLCTNAEHAMREKGGTMYIKLGRVDVDEAMAGLHHDLHPGPYVRFEVKDTGYGIESANMERIFDPYFTTKGVGEGTGLGLAVVQGIVGKHGGAITVESEEGKGTTFRVFFPIIEGEKDEIQGREMIEKPLPTGNERILFIDDEKVLAELGKDILQRLGYKVTIRTSSLEALELFKAKPGYFDLVITDMSMPNMTGEQFSRELIKLRPDIPIILCTGFSHLISKDKALEIGIKAFAMKPLARKDLVETVRHVLDQKNATEA
ncbi:MAG: PAS domain S-box protein [Deltaproteobacteria bacterium]|nr:PAS domain S-box protein [Deltaproteobacteria bacterium]